MLDSEEKLVPVGAELVEDGEASNELDVIKDVLSVVGELLLGGSEVSSFPSGSWERMLKALG